MAEEIEALSAAGAANVNNSEPLTLNERMVAAFLDIDLATLRRWRTKGEGPAFVPITRETVVYLFRDVLDFLTARRRLPGGRRA